jgi:hypothetical protein
MAVRIPEPPPAGVKRLVGLAVAMAIAAGIYIISVPRHDRINVGRPLGNISVKLSNGIAFERKDVNVYALTRSEYLDVGRARQLAPTMHADMAYLSQPPQGWQNASWPARASMVADNLVNAKLPGRSGRTCWVGRLSLNKWIALPYQQTFYSSDGIADEHYRGIFLIFELRMGGLVLLDLFKRRSDPETTHDWIQVREYLADVNRMVHVRYNEGNRLIGPDDDLSEIIIPKRSPRCLGSYLMDPPKGTNLYIEKGGYYRLNDTHRGVEGFVGYRRNLASGLVDDPYQVFRAERCRPRLRFLKGQPGPDGRGNVTMRYTRTTHASDGLCTPRFYGLLASRRLPDGSAITFDVFVRSHDRGQSPPAHRWRQINQYLHSLEQQLLSKCDQPGMGNVPGMPQPASVRSVTNRPASSPLRIDANGAGRCLS